MKKSTNNIISIGKDNSTLAYGAFVDLMHKTEKILNDKANSNRSFFKKISPYQLEEVSLDSIKEASSSTPFRPDEIKLVSGLAFPDIVAEKYYGVEVKSTHSNQWKSTGSSIIETTRINNIEKIYLLFGKLGGNPEFRCRPYEECLYDITVTHSPRYLIDMNANRDNTIFAKMHTTYDKLRTSENSISQVRLYYRNKAIKENKGEMPWWLEDIEGASDNLMIRHFSTLNKDEKLNIVSQLYILFPQCMINGEYLEPSMWLTAYHQIVSHNMRDYFSAGGQVKRINGKPLNHPLPAITKRFVDSSPRIKRIIYEMGNVIEIYNPDLLTLSVDLFQAWVFQVDTLLRNKYGKEVSFLQWIENEDRLER